jgi:hypothetical protein
MARKLNRLRIVMAWYVHAGVSPSPSVRHIHGLPVELRGDSPGPREEGGNSDE